MDQYLLAYPRNMILFGKSIRRGAVEAVFKGNGLGKTSKTGNGGGVGRESADKKRNVTIHTY